MECNTRYEDKRVEWYVQEKKDGKNIYQWVMEKPETNDVNDKAAKINKNDGSKKSDQSKVSTYTRYCDNPHEINYSLHFVIKVDQGKGKKHSIERDSVSANSHIISKRRLTDVFIIQLCFLFSFEQEKPKVSVSILFTIRFYLLDDSLSLTLPYFPGLMSRRQGRSRGDL